MAGPVGPHPLDPQYSTSRQPAAPAVVFPTPGLPSPDPTLVRNPGIYRRQANPVPAVDACPTIGWADELVRFWVTFDPDRLFSMDRC